MSIHKASVVILTKNPGPIFKKVIEAVLGQDTPWSFEVLVVDSGSKDGTIQLCKENPKIRLHQIPSSEFGHGKTRNLGVSLCQSQFIAMLTHDALPVDNKWLNNLVTKLELYPEAAGAFGRHVAYEETSPFVARDIQFHFDSFLKGGPAFKIEDSERYKIDEGYRQFLHFFSDNNACLRKSVWEKIPYPEVDFAEDQIWAKTIIENGFSKVFVDEAVVYHSHNYSLVESFRRSFDESVALKKLFGYVLCGSLPRVIKNTFSSSQMDIRFLLNQPWRVASLAWFLKQPWFNFAKNIGQYLGAKFDDSSVIYSWISLDYSKKRK